MRIIYKIYEIRTKKGLSLTQLAELSGVSKSQINRIENGESDPTITVLCMLADALNVEPCELFIIQKE